MNLLIVGDFSSAGHFLAQGFRSVGIAVTHVAYQNGWRKNPIEINLTSHLTGVAGRIHNYIRPLTLNHLKNYDAVLFLDYFVFPRTFGINSIMTRRIQENNGPSFLWNIGCDSQMAKWGRINDFDLCNPCLIYDQQALVCKCESNERAENEFLAGITKIIPGAYEYFESHIANPKVTNPIQFAIPVNQDIDTVRAVEGNRIKVFHGLNRYGFKGTHIVEKVFSSLTEQYSNKADFLIKGHMPFKEYNELLIKQDVIVDQVFSKTLGINSLMSLASGKILVSSDPTLGCAAYQIPVPPMISCEPSIVGLERSMKNVLDNYGELGFDGDDAKSYVATYHSPKLVAQKFTDVFGW